MWGTAVGTLCDRVGTPSWSRSAADRFVIHVARKDASPVVAEIARTFVRHLSEMVTRPRIGIIDPAARPGEWAPHTVIPIGGIKRYRVAVARLRAGAAIPALWLEPFSLVTIAGAAPDVRLRLHAALAAQASLLDGEGRDVDVLFEAHRLMPSDLAIACGSLTFGDPGSGTWWAASDDDVALEAAVVRASGGRLDTIPHLRHFRRHELIEPSPTDTDETSVRLHGHLASAARTRVARLGVATRHAGRTLRDDVARAAENLHRIPQFVVRRWSGAVS
jgi:hypothetical protein